MHSKRYNFKIHQNEKLIFSVQIQSKPKSESEFVLRDTAKSELLDLVDVRCSIFSGICHSVPITNVERRHLIFSISLKVNGFLTICTFVHALLNFSRLYTLLLHLYIHLYSSLFISLFITVFISIHLSIHLYPSLYSSLSSSIFISIHLSSSLFISLHLSVRHSIHLYSLLHSSLFISIHLCIHLYSSLFISIHLCIHLYSSLCSSLYSSLFTTTLTISSGDRYKIFKIFENSIFENSIFENYNCVMCTLTNVSPSENSQRTKNSQKTALRSFYMGVFM